MQQLFVTEIALGRPRRGATNLGRPRHVIRFNRENILSHVSQAYAKRAVVNVYGVVAPDPQTRWPSRTSPGQRRVWVKLRVAAEFGTIER